MKKTPLLLFFGFLASQAPSSETRHLRLADAFFDAHAYSLAADEYGAAILGGENLNEAQARVRLGQSYQRLGDYPRAIAAYQGFLDAHPADPQAPEAWLGLGLSLQAHGRYEESQRALAGLLKAYPQHPLAQEAAFAAAEDLYYLDHFQDSESAYRELADKYPQFSRPQYLPYARAWCFYRLGQVPSREGSADLKKQSLQQAVALFAQVGQDWPASPDLAPLRALPARGSGLCPGRLQGGLPGLPEAGGQVPGSSPGPRGPLFHCLVRFSGRGLGRRPPRPFISSRWCTKTTSWRPGPCIWPG